MVTRTGVLGGRYVLAEVLGTGGMATVWRATDQVLGREVAVKVLSPQLAADAGFMARFEREAQHAARLSHPRLVTVFDSGIDEGTAFIVMELVAGRTLRQVLDDVRILPPGQAVGIAVGVCEALAVAHAAGLVHRDIKPANIVVTGGEVKVLDFGIARADGSAGLTRTQTVLGTAAYLSPEQASGRPAGPQSDLYSLGCVLFEMITGAPPFTADSAVGLAYRHVHDDPGSPSARRPGVPPQLDWITAQLLAKEPAARPSSAAAAKAGLLAALHPDATAVLTTPGDDGGLPGPGGGGHRRPTRVEILLGVALAAVVVVLAAVLLTGAPGHAAPRTAPSVTPSGTTHSSATHSAAHKTHKPAQRASALPPVAAAAATFVGDLEAGVATGQVAPQAGQDLYNHLHQLLFSPPGQDPQQIQRQYAQLLQSYDQRQSQGQITGHAAIVLRHALRALGAAVGALQPLRLAPSAKLAAAHWVGREAWVEGLPQTSDDACYRAMDWLHQVKEPVEQEIQVRARMLAQLTEMIKGSDALSRDKRAELRGVISTKPGLNRYLRVTPGGLLRTDASKVKAEENLDGKYLLRTSDPKMTAGDIALGYQQLAEVERGWRDLKQVIDLRPACHRKEERIRAHVILCWLALLLIRVAETSTATTWNKIADEFSLLTLGTFTGPAGTFRQTAELTKTQRDLLTKLKITHPKKITEATPATP